MTVVTATGQSIDKKMLHNYFKTLVNRFFKILPIRESGEASLSKYMRSLQDEMMGARAFLPPLSEEPMMLSLLSILQYLIDNPECSVRDVRSHVFSAISVCNKLQSIYAEVEPDGSEVVG